MSKELFSGKYQVQREIAQGGMGVIYHALDLTLRRDVVIKVLHSQFARDPAFAQRFLREARAMARLDHPHITRIYAVEEEGDIPFIVMEYVPGKDLKGVLREQGTLPLNRALFITHQTAEALAYAHDKGIVHRDIKPGNILLLDEDQVKITDFGIAAALDESSVTVTGTIIGTPEYMSPEQARGDQVDTRSDLYSLGMVMYEMLTGVTPYKGTPGPSIIGKLAFDPSEPLLTFPPGIPEDIETLIRGLINKESHKRSHSAHQIIARLTHHMIQDEPTKKIDHEETRILSHTKTKHSTTVSTDQEHNLEAGMEGKKTSFVTRPFTQEVDGEKNHPESQEPFPLSHATGSTSPYSPDPTDPPRMLHAEPQPQWPYRLAVIFLVTLLLFIGIIYVVSQWPPSIIETRQSPEIETSPSTPTATPTQESSTIQSPKDTGSSPMGKEHDVPHTLPLKSQAQTSAKTSQPKKRVNAQKTPESTQSVSGQQKSNQLNQQKVNTVIEQLAKIQQEFEHKTQHHEKQISKLTTLRIELKEQADQLLQHVDQEGSRARLHAIRQTLTTLRKTFTEDHNHQIRLNQTLLTQAKKAIHDADLIIKKGTTEAHYRRLSQIHKSLSTIQTQSTEQLNTDRVQWDEYFTHLEHTLTQAKQKIQLVENQLERERQNIAEKNAKEEKLMAERRRREAEQAANAEKEHLRQAEKTRKQVARALHIASTLTQQLEEMASQEQLENRAVLSKIESLSGEVNTIHAQSASPNAEGQLDTAQGQLNSLEQELLKKSHRQRAHTEKLLKEVEAALDQLETISNERLDDLQSQRVTQAKKKLLMAKDQLVFQRISRMENWQTNKVNIEKGLKQTASQILQVKKNREAEAKQVAALEAAQQLEKQQRLEAERQRLIAELKKKEQEEQQRREAEAKRQQDKAQRLAALQAEQAKEQARAEEARKRRETEAQAETERLQVTALLNDFQKAYETQSLSTLHQITNMDAKRVQYLQLMFRTYETIRVATEIQSITDQEASAKLLITQLIDRKGKVVIPSPIIKEMKITIPKDGEQWGKIQW